MVRPYFAKVDDCGVNGTKIFHCCGKNPNDALANYLHYGFESYCVDFNVTFGNRVSVIIMDIDRKIVSRNKIMCTFNGGF